MNNAFVAYMAGLVIGSGCISLAWYLSIKNLQRNYKKFMKDEGIQNG